MHVHTHDILRTSVPLSTHLADPSALRPFTVAFFDREFTLDVDIDYAYLAAMSPDTLKSLHPERFLRGRVVGTAHTSTSVRLYLYERGAVDGAIRLVQATHVEEYRFEALVDDATGELTGQVAVFRDKDRKRPMASDGSGPARYHCGHTHHDHHAGTAAGNAANMTTRAKLAPQDYKGHDSLSVLHQANVLHLRNQQDGKKPVDDFVQRRLHETRKALLHKRGTTNQYKSVVLSVYYSSSLEPKGQSTLQDSATMATWLSQVYADMSTRYAELGLSVIPKYITRDNGAFGSHTNMTKLLIALQDRHKAELEQRHDVFALQYITEKTFPQNATVLGLGTTPPLSQQCTKGLASFGRYQDDNLLRNVLSHELAHNLAANHSGADPSLMAAVDESSPFSQKQWTKDTVDTISASMHLSCIQDPGTVALTSEETSGPVGPRLDYTGSLTVPDNGGHLRSSWMESNYRDKLGSAVPAGKGTTTLTVPKTPSGGTAPPRTVVVVETAPAAGGSQPAPSITDLLATLVPDNPVQQAAGTAQAAPESIVAPSPDDASADEKGEQTIVTEVSQ
ncbi:hypothetical protein RI367_006201 [Sorochytrium milnesiophthora]